MNVSVIVPPASIARTRGLRSPSIPRASLFTPDQPVASQSGRRFAPLLGARIRRGGSAREHGGDHTDEARHDPSLPPSPVSVQQPLRDATQRRVPIAG
jgi:hypothetical protein